MASYTAFLMLCVRRILPSALTQSELALLDFRHQGKKAGQVNHKSEIRNTFNCKVNLIIATTGQVEILHGPDS